MEKDLCYIIENDMIVSSLTQVLETEYKEAVNIKRDCKIVGCTIPKNYAREDSRKPLPLAQITLNDGSVLHTKLLVSCALKTKSFSTCFVGSKLGRR